MNGGSARALSEKIAGRLREHGWTGLSKWALREFAVRIVRTHTLDVLKRDVTKPFPVIAAKMPVEFRVLTHHGGGVECFLRDWPVHRALFEERLRGGLHCIAAFREERSLGYIWITSRPERDAQLGLTVTPADDELYGFDLYVLPECRPQMIGQELITRWLDQTRRSGRQWALGVVEDINRPMQITSRVVFGFKTAERVRSLEFFGRWGIITSRTIVR